MCLCMKKCIYYVFSSGLYIYIIKIWYKNIIKIVSFPGGSDGKASVCDTGDLGSIPGLGRSPGEGNGNPPQYSSLENPINGGGW